MSIIHLSTSQPLTRETIQQLHGDKDWPGQNRSAAISFRRRGFGEKEEVGEHPLPDWRHKDRADRSRGQLAACVGEQSAAAAGRRHATRDWNDERAATGHMGRYTSGGGGVGGGDLGPPDRQERRRRQQQLLRHCLAVYTGT
jgi:hypothetical protein